MKQGAESLVYFDESGFERETYRPYAYARKGQKIHGNRPGKRSQRTHLILAKQAGKLLAPMLFQGTATTALVNQWLEQSLLKEIRPHSTIILDNARFHHKTELKRIAESQGHRLLFLPPYSPDFNPIEKTFAQIKKYRQNQPQDKRMDDIILEFGNYLE